MLTSSLVRVRTQRGSIEASFVDPTNERLVERADQLCELFNRAESQRLTRAEITAAVREIEGFGVDHKMTRGLAKVLSDASEFQMLAPIEPPDLRARLFALSAKRGPLARRAGPTNRLTATGLMAEVAEEFGCTPEEIRHALFADLKEQQVLSKAKGWNSRQLLDRYNVALVQAILLKASKLSLTLHQPDPKRVRQLYRAIKFHRLMYRVATSDNRVIFELDGPESLLRLSTRYGLQISTFFPSILLQPGAWDLQATVHWGKRRLRKAFSLSQENGLVSHYRDQGTWRSRTEIWFEERFQALNSDWSIEPGTLLDLGEQQMLVPDFTFRKGKRTAHLDIVGYWRKGYLKARVEQTPPNVVLAVSTRLAGEAAKSLPKQVVGFAEVIPPKEVVARLEAIAC